MGCDIHIFAEYKRAGSKKWEHDKYHTKVKDVLNESFDFEELPFGGNRDYGLFGALAGVRRGGCIFEQRGIPDDVSTRVGEAIEQWGSDGHSHSYLSISEFSQVLEAYYKDIDLNQFQYSETTFDNYNEIVTHCFNVIEKSKVDAILLNEPSLGYEECRIVFFFDN